MSDIIYVHEHVRQKHVSHISLNTRTSAAQPTHTHTRTHCTSLPVLPLRITYGWSVLAATLSTHTSAATSKNMHADSFLPTIDSRCHARRSAPVGLQRSNTYKCTREGGGKGGGEGDIHSKLERLYEILKPVLLHRLVQVNPIDS